MAGTFFKRDGLFAHMSLIPYIIRRFIHIPTRAIAYAS